MPECIQYVFQFGVQIVNVLRNDVCQGPAFGLIPHVFHRIEVGRVRWKPFDLEPGVVIFKKSAGSGAMSRQAIPHQNDWTAQMTMDIADKANEIRCPRVVIQKFVVQSQPQRPRSPCDGGDRRDAIASVPGPLNGRVACRGPHSPPQGLQQIATFVDKNQASLAFEALFLVAARCRDAIGQCPIRCVLGPAVRASADSSPTDAATAAHTPDENLRQTIAGSCPAPTVRSNRQAHNPNIACRASMQRRVLSVAGLKVWASCQDEPSLEACSHASTHFASGTPMTHWNRLPQPHPSTTRPSRRAWPRSSDGLRASRGFLLVSCSNCTELTTFSIN